MNSYAMFVVVVVIWSSVICGNETGVVKNTVDTERSKQICQLACGPYGLNSRHARLAKKFFRSSIGTYMLGQLHVP